MIRKIIGQDKNGSPKKGINPYKGLNSYEETDKDVFHGRDDETEHLLQLIKSNLLSVVIGKSGIGKTSLLNAGVFPLLREDGFLPIRLRLKYSDSTDAVPLVEQVRRAIGKELVEFDIAAKDHSGNDSTISINNCGTFWEYFHKAGHFVTENSGKKVTLILVFDQFEEFFTLGKKHNTKDKDDLIDELYWLIEDQLPSTLKSQLSNKEIRGRWLSLSKAPLDARVVISLREDYLPHFNSLKDRIPSIDRNQFRVKPLNGVQAREIITMPDGIREERIVKDILRRFYPQAVKKNKIPDEEKLEIEPTFLSLLCQQLLEKYDEDKKLLKNVSKEYQDKILANFYDSEMMEEFSEKTGREEIKKFIESKLLTESGYRTPFFLEPDHKLKNEVDQLIERRILRRFHDGENEYIEVIHDVLVPIIKERRNKRLDKLRKQKLKKKLIRRLTIRTISVSAIILAVIAVYALYQKNRADELYRNAQVGRLTAEASLEFLKDNTKAIHIAGAAYEMALPDPPAGTSRIIGAFGYSSFDTPFYVAVLHHEGPVYVASFSPDDTLILTASEDGTAKIWTREGNLLANLDKHSARIKTAAFSPDGTRMITGSWDRTATLWDTKGNLLVRLNEHKGAVLSVSFSPDGSRVVTASQDGSAKIWDLEGRLLTDLDINNNIPVFSARFSPDGSKVITASWDDSVKVWNLEGDIITKINNIETTSSVFLSPDGSRILTSLFDGTTRVWNLQGESIANIKHSGMVANAGFSPDGKRIFTAAKDGTAKVRDIRENILEYPGNIGLVTFSVFSPDGELLLTADKKGAAKIWDIKNNSFKNIRHNQRIHCAAFSSDGSQLITASEDGTAKLWQLKNEILVDLKHTESVNNAVFSPDGEKILTASEDGTAKLWNLDGSPLKEVARNSVGVSTALFSPDGSRVLANFNDGTVRLWNILDNTRLSLEIEDEEVITYAGFSPKGNLMLTVSENDTAKLRDLQGKVQSELGEAGENTIFAVFAPDGSRVLTAHKEGAAKLWNLEGKLLQDLGKHSANITAAGFSPDSRRLLTAYEDGRAKLWDEGGNLPAELIKHNQAITSAVFSPDGQRILTASKDGTAKLWNLAGQLLADLDKHRAEVNSAIFSPDGQRILTASEDGTAKLWNLQGEILADLDKHRTGVNTAVFSPDGQRILTASKDKTAKTWYTPEAISRWLKRSKIPRLRKEDKNNPDI